MLYEPKGTTVEVALDSASDAYFMVLSPIGEFMLTVDQTYDGREEGSFETQIEAPHFVIVGQYGDTPAQVELTSSHDLVRYPDPDDGRRVHVGDTIVGCGDYPADADYFEIDLEAGQKVEITVRSVALDPFLAIAYPGLSRDQIVGDDDSGGGVTGLEAQFAYEAPHYGVYWIVVGDVALQNRGGYLLMVESAD